MLDQLNRTTEGSITWKDAIKPIRDKFWLAYKCGAETSFTTAGSEAIYQLLDKMTDVLDQSDRRNEQRSHKLDVFNFWVAPILTGVVIGYFLGKVF